MRCNNTIIFFRFNNLRCRSQGVHEFESNHYLDNKIHGENSEWHPRCRYPHHTVNPATSTTCYKSRENNSNGKQMKPFMECRGKGDLKEDVKKIWKGKNRAVLFLVRRNFLKIHLNLILFMFIDQQNRKFLETRELLYFFLQHSFENPFAYFYRKEIRGDLV